MFSSWDPAQGLGREKVFEEIANVHLKFILDVARVATKVPTGTRQIRISDENVEFFLHYVLSLQVIVLKNLAEFPFELRGHDLENLDQQQQDLTLKHQQMWPFGILLDSKFRQHLALF